MYSGSDSTGSQNYNQWPLNPAAYQNTPNEQIDWAALAQQWIIMKEAGPPVPEQITTNALPASSIVHKAKIDHLSEGGEAPMEVENEKETDVRPQWNKSPASTEGGWNWNQQQPQWGWGNNTWSAPAGVPPPPGNAKAPLLPTPPSYNQYAVSNDNANNFGPYNRPSSEYPGGYWTGNANKIKPHNKRYSKVNIPPPPRPQIPVTAPSEPVMLDATKRKQLPAWIREGLEKMERDKQKQLEREREKLEKEDQVEMSKFDEKEALEIIKSTVKERERSKFESDGENSEDETSNKKMRESPESAWLTQEELMLRVRRSMTEILLKVTNEQIRAVCKEEFQRHLRKYKASDQRVSASGGTNISAKLGVGIYGDSGSSNNNSEDESSDDGDASDTELKNAIRKRKAEFSKTERQIEERLAAAEKHHIDDDSRGGTPKTDDCDSQVDAKFQGRLKLGEVVTPPKTIPSQSKHLKTHSTSTSSSIVSDAENDRQSGHKERNIDRTKKSSSSESNRSPKPTKIRSKKSITYTRSVTPDRKKIKEKASRGNERRKKHSESSSSKSSSLHSRKSRSKSAERRRSRSLDKYQRRNRSSYSKRSHSRSSSRSHRSKSYRSRSRSKRSRSRSRKSRSNSRGWSPSSRCRTKSDYKSRSRVQRSRTPDRRSRHKLHSRHKSKSYSPEVQHGRVRSRSTSRGKKSYRY